MSTHSKNPLLRAPSMRTLVFLLVLVIGLEICMDVCLIAGGGGAPITTTESKPIDKKPETDQEFVATSIDTLKSAGWWRDGSTAIYSLMYKTECASVNLPSGRWWLFARRQTRVTLYTSHLYEMTTNYNRDLGQINYTIEDYLFKEKFTFESIDFDNIRVWSKEALQLAEQNGGAEVRLVNDNKCNISMSIGADGVWDVDYLRESTFDRLLCLDIDQTSREVNVVSNRGDKACLNQE